MPRLWISQFTVATYNFIWNMLLLNSLVHLGTAKRFKWISSQRIFTKQAQCFAPFMSCIIREMVHRQIRLMLIQIVHILCTPFQVTIPFFFFLSNIFFVQDNDFVTSIEHLIFSDVSSHSRILHFNFVVAFWFQDHITSHLFRGVNPIQTRVREHST